MTDNRYVAGSVQHEIVKLLQAFSQIVTGEKSVEVSPRYTEVKHGVTVRVK